jgi:hypothetical protein
MANQILFDDFRTQWLEDVLSDSPSTTELGRRFARKLLTQWLDVEGSSDEIIYCDGAGDGGIDIAYLDRGESSPEDGEGISDGHTWHLVQSKYGKAFQGTGTIIEEGQKVIDTLNGQRPRLSSLAEGLLEQLHTFQMAASDRDRLTLVFATESPLTDEQRRALGDIRAMGRERLGPIFDVSSVSVETIYLRNLEDLESADRAHIRLVMQANMVPSGANLLVGSVSLMELYKFLKSYRHETEDLDQLFEKNVRRFLGTRGRVNKAMFQTLHERPEQFGLFNNGITVVVTDFNEVDGSSVEIVDPYIVNGCQTTRTIWEVFHRRLESGGTGDSPELAEWKSAASRGVVVTKMVKVGLEGESLLQAITRYTNTQNAVREKDFLTLTSDFRTWSRLMEERYGVFLEIQRGGWDSQRALQRQKPDVRQFTEYANAFDLLKVYGAGWFGEAGAAFGRNAAFLPNGSVFKRIMNSEAMDEPFGVEDLYAAYRLQRSADEFRFGRGAPKSSRRQTRFLFYMVAVELLRDVVTRTIASSQVNHKDVTRSFLQLWKPGNEDAASALMDAAIEVVDEYLTPNVDNSLYGEPSFQNSFGSDVNRFLKWEQLGKTDQATSNLRGLLALTKSVMGRRAGASESPRDLIGHAISAT